MYVIAGASSAGAAGFCGVAGDGVLQVQGGTLELIGSGAGDKLSTASSPSDPGQLLVDVGEDGTIDFTSNRSTFDAIDVQAGGGNDTVETSNGLATFGPLTPRATDSRR